MVKRITKPQEMSKTVSVTQAEPDPDKPLEIRRQLVVSKYGMPSAEDVLFARFSDETKAAVMAQIQEIATSVAAASDHMTEACNLYPFVIEHLERQGYKVNFLPWNSAKPTEQRYRITWQVY